MNNVVNPKQPTTVIYELVLKNALATCLLKVRYIWSHGKVPRIMNKENKSKKYYADAGLCFDFLTIGLKFYGTINLIRLYGFYVV